MFSAVTSIDRFDRIKAAQGRAKGGELSAFSLVKELAAEGLDIVERQQPPLVKPTPLPATDYDIPQFLTRSVPHDDAPGGLGVG